ncbi:glycosyltransferase family protein 8, putative [Babesia caballi]|uniref:Glycosyltransferase family protein 8, putative n=1 Tax=Babesia caballi TaxID=5871 RepID=A0AAV4M1G1_BABCB|nr:glycosyltransferase family protein 8, putative [Babesia caballi]
MLKVLNVKQYNSVQSQQLRNSVHHVEQGDGSTHVGDPPPKEELDARRLKLRVEAVRLQNLVGLLYLLHPLGRRTNHSVVTRDLVDARRRDTDRHVPLRRQRLPEEDLRVVHAVLPDLLEANRRAAELLERGRAPALVGALENRALHRGLAGPGEVVRELTHLDVQGVAKLLGHPDCKVRALRHRAHVAVRRDVEAHAPVGVELHRDVGELVKRALEVRHADHAVEVAVEVLQEGPQLVGLRQRLLRVGVDEPREQLPVELVCLDGGHEPSRPAALARDLVKPDVQQPHDQLVGAGVAEELRQPRVAAERCLDVLHHQPHLAQLLEVLQALRRRDALEDLLQQHDLAEGVLHLRVEELEAGVGDAGLQPDQRRYLLRARLRVGQRGVEGLEPRAQVAQPDLRLCPAPVQPRPDGLRLRQSHHQEPPLLVDTVERYHALNHRLLRVLVLWPGSGLAQFVRDVGGDKLPVLRLLRVDGPDDAEHHGQRHGIVGHAAQNLKGALEPALHTARYRDVQRLRRRHLGRSRPLQHRRAAHLLLLQLLKLLLLLSALLLHRLHPRQNVVLQVARDVNHNDDVLQAAVRVGRPLDLVEVGADREVVGEGHRQLRRVLPEEVKVLAAEEPAARRILGQLVQVPPHNVLLAAAVPVGERHFLLHLVLLLLHLLPLVRRLLLLFFLLQHLHLLLVLGVEVHVLHRGPPLHLQIILLQLRLLGLLALRLRRQLLLVVHLLLALVDQLVVLRRENVQQLVPHRRLDHRFRALLAGGVGLLDVRELHRHHGHVDERLQRRVVDVVRLDEHADAVAERPLLREGAGDRVVLDLAEDVDAALQPLGRTRNDAQVVLDELLEVLLAHHVLHRLLQQHPRELHLAHDAAHNQPLHALPDLALFRLLVRRNQRLHLAGNDQVQRLSLADSSHSPRALRVVPEGHVRANGDEGTRVCRLPDVLTRGVHLVVEAQPAVRRDPAVRQQRRAPTVTQQHHLPVHVVQIHHAVHVVQTALEQLLGHLQVAEARDERTRVDERQRLERALGHNVQDRLAVPALLQYHRPLDHRVVRQYLQNHAVRALAVVALAHLHRQQLRGRPREPESDGEQHGTSEFHRARRQLQVRVLHRVREEHVTQEVLNHQPVVLQQVVQHVQLLLVVDVDDVQGPNVRGAVNVLHRAEYVLVRDVAQVVVLPGRLALRLPQAPARAQHPPVEGLVRLPVGQVSRLLVELLRQVPQRQHKVRPPQPLVEVGQDREPDQHVGVRELRVPARRALAHEGHRKHAPRLRRVGVDHQNLLHLLDAQHTVVDQVDPRDDVREGGPHPLLGEGEHLDRLQRPVGHPRGQELQALLVRLVHQLVPLQVQAHPLRHQRQQLPEVPLLVQQHQVRRVSRVASHHALAEAPLDALQQLRLVLRNLLLGVGHHHAQHVPRQQPPDLVVRVAQVRQRPLVPDGPVQLTLERVQQQVDFVHEHDGVGEELQYAQAHVQLKLDGAVRVVRRTHLTLVLILTLVLFLFFFLFLVLTLALFLALALFLFLFLLLNWQRNQLCRPLHVPHLRQTLVQVVHPPHRPLVHHRTGLQLVEARNDLQENRLDAGRCANDHRPGLLRLKQLQVQLRGRPVEPAEPKREDALVDDRRELLPKRGPRELQQRVRADLHKQPLAVSQQHRQQRTHHRGLTLSHNHLVAPTLAVAGRLHKVPHQLHLPLVQQDVAREFKQQQTRVQNALGLPRGRLHQRHVVPRRVHPVRQRPTGGADVHLERRQIVPGQLALGELLHRLQHQHQLANRFRRQTTPIHRQHHSRHQTEHVPRPVNERVKNQQILLPLGRHQAVHQVIQANQTLHTGQLSEYVAPALHDVHVVVVAHRLVQNRVGLTQRRPDANLHELAVGLEELQQPLAQNLQLAELLRQHFRVRRHLVNPRQREPRELPLALLRLLVQIVLVVLLQAPHHLARRRVLHDPVPLQTYRQPPLLLRDLHRLARRLRVHHLLQHLRPHGADELGVNHRVAHAARRDLHALPAVLRIVVHEGPRHQVVPLRDRGVHPQHVLVLLVALVVLRPRDAFALVQARARALQVRQHARRRVDVHVLVDAALVHRAVVVVHAGLVRQRELYLLRQRVVPPRGRHLQLVKRVENRQPVRQRRVPPKVWLALLQQLLLVLRRQTAARRHVAQVRHVPHQLLVEHPVDLRTLVLLAHERLLDCTEYRLDVTLQLLHAPLLLELDALRDVQPLAARRQQQVQPARVGVRVLVARRVDLGQNVPVGAFLAALVPVVEERGLAEPAHLLVLPVEEPVEQQKEPRRVRRHEQKGPRRVHLVHVVPASRVDRRQPVLVATVVYQLRPRHSLQHLPDLVRQHQPVPHFGEDPHRVPHRGDQNVQLAVLVRQQQTVLQTPDQRRRQRTLPHVAVVQKQPVVLLAHVTHYPARPAAGPGRAERQPQLRKLNHLHTVAVPVRPRQNVAQVVQAQQRLRHQLDPNPRLRVPLRSRRLGVPHDVRRLDVLPEEVLLQQHVWQQPPHARRQNELLLARRRVVPHHHVVLARVADNQQRVARLRRRHRRLAHRQLRLPALHPGGAHVPRQAGAEGPHGVRAVAQRAVPRAPVLYQVEDVDRQRLPHHDNLLGHRPLGARRLLVALGHHRVVGRRHLRRVLARRALGDLGLPAELRDGRRGVGDDGRNGRDGLHRVLGHLHQRVVVVGNVLVSAVLDAADVALREVAHRDAVNVVGLPRVVARDLVGRVEPHRVDHRHLDVVLQVALVARRLKVRRVRRLGQVHRPLGQVLLQPRVQHRRQPLEPAVAAARLVRHLGRDRVVPRVPLPPDQIVLAPDQAHPVSVAVQLHRRTLHRRPPGDLTQQLHVVRELVHPLPQQLQPVLLERQLARLEVDLDVTVLHHPHLEPLLVRLDRTRHLVELLLAPQLAVHLLAQRDRHVHRPLGVVHHQVLGLADQPSVLLLHHLLPKHLVRGRVNPSLHLRIKRPRRVVVLRSSRVHVVVHVEALHQHVLNVRVILVRNRVLLELPVHPRRLSEAPRHHRELQLVPVVSGVHLRVDLGRLRLRHGKLAHLLHQLFQNPVAGRALRPQVLQEPRTDVLHHPEELQLRHEQRLVVLRLLIHHLGHGAVHRLLHRELVVHKHEYQRRAQRQQQLVLVRLLRRPALLQSGVDLHQEPVHHRHVRHGQRRGVLLVGLGRLDRAPPQRLGCLHQQRAHPPLERLQLHARRLRLQLQPPHVAAPPAAADARLTRLLRRLRLREPVVQRSLHHVLAHMRRQPHRERQHLGRVAQEDAVVPLKRQLQHLLHRQQHRAPRKVNLVEEQPQRRREHVRRLHRRHLRVHMLVGHAPPESRLEDRGHHHLLQRRRGHGVQVGLAREELHNQGDAHVRCREVLQQQLRVPAAQVAPVVWQLLQVQHVRLVGDLRVVDQVVRVRRARRRLGLARIHEPLHHLLVVGLAVLLRVAHLADRRHLQLLAEGLDRQSRRGSARRDRPLERRVLQRVARRGHRRPRPPDGLCDEDHVPQVPKLRKDRRELLALARIVPADVFHVAVEAQLQRDQVHQQLIARPDLERLLPLENQVLRPQHALHRLEVVQHLRPRNHRQRVRQAVVAALRPKVAQREPEGANGPVALARVEQRDVARRVNRHLADHRVRDGADGAQHDRLLALHRARPDQRAPQNVDLRLELNLPRRPEAHHLPRLRHRAVLVAHRYGQRQRQHLEEHVPDQLEAPRVGVRDGVPLVRKQRAGLHAPPQHLAHVAEVPHRHLHRRQLDRQQQLLPHRAPGELVDVGSVQPKVPKVLKLAVDVVLRVRQAQLPVDGAGALPHSQRPGRQLGLQVDVHLADDARREIVQLRHALQRRGRVIVQPLPLQSQRPRRLGDAGEGAVGRAHQTRHGRGGLDRELLAVAIHVDQLVLVRPVQRLLRQHHGEPLARDLHEQRRAADAQLRRVLVLLRQRVQVLVDQQAEAQLEHDVHHAHLRVVVVVLAQNQLHEGRHQPRHRAGLVRVRRRVHPHAAVVGRELVEHLLRGVHLVHLAHVLLAQLREGLDQHLLGRVARRGLLLGFLLLHGRLGARLRLRLQLPVQHQRLGVEVRQQHLVQVLVVVRARRVHEAEQREPEGAVQQPVLGDVLAHHHRVHLQLPHLRVAVELEGVVLNAQSPRVDNAEDVRRRLGHLVHGVAHPLHRRLIRELDPSRYQEPAVVRQVLQSRQQSEYKAMQHGEVAVPRRDARVEQVLPERRVDHADGLLRLQKRGVHLRRHQRPALFQCLVDDPLQELRGVVQAARRRDARRWDDRPRVEREVLVAAQLHEAGISPYPRHFLPCL